MNKIAPKFALVLAAILATAATGCAVYPAHSQGPGYGPPPHAPAHGYRARYHDHDLVFDAGLGVYVVVGLPDIYFYNGIYLRYSHEGWQHSRYADRDWRRYDDHKIPPGLAKKHPGKGKGDGHPGRGNDRDRDD
jgi:hypothetical protein